MEAGKRVEVVLIPGEIKKDFSLWKFIRRHLKALILLLVAGVIVGGVVAIVYMSVPAEVPPVPAAQEEVSVFPAEDMAFMEAKLTGRDVGNMEIAYRIDEEIAYTNYLFSKLLLAFEQERSVLPYQTQQLQNILISVQEIMVGVENDVPMHPSLLINDKAEVIQALIAENERTMDAYREELEQGNTAVVNYLMIVDEKANERRSDDTEYAGMRVRIKELEEINTQLAEILRGGALFATEDIEAEALQRRIDIAVMLVDDVKTELLGIVRALDDRSIASTVPAAPSVIMAMAIFLAAVVGIFCAGIVVLLIMDSIRGADAKNDEGEAKT